MRLVSWNCRSGFHRKLDGLATLAPDVAIVSECANLEILASKAPGLQPASALWVGTNPHKGLGVFSFGRYRLVRDDRAYDPSITFALPVQVKGPSTWHVLALWAHHGLSGRTMSVRGPNAGGAGRVPALRPALDAIHLACALVLGGELRTL